MPAARRPEPLRGRVFRSRDVLAAGLLTREALRSSVWRRLFRGVYADSSLSDGADLRIAGAALLLPADGVFSGRTAAHLLGAEELLEVGSPLEVTVPPGRSFGPVTGLRIRRATLARSDVRRARGHRCTAAVRTALDIARHEPLMDAVPSVDVLLRLGLVLDDELAAAAGALPTGRGSRRARRAVGLSDGRAESPQESRLRVLLALAGIPPVPQYKVFDGSGRFLARVDFGYPELKIAIEYDGVWHAEAGQFRRDRRRLNELVGAGWLVLHVTAADLRDPEAVVERVRQLHKLREMREMGV